MPATKSSNGTWIVRFYYDTREGVRKQKFSRGWKTKREALEFEREFLTATMNYEAPQEELFFKTLCTLYLEDSLPRVKSTTFSQRKGILERNVIPFFESYLVKDITPKIVREFHSKLLTSRTIKGVPLSQTYLKSINIALSSVFNFGMRFLEVKTNPCVLVGKFGKARSNEMKIWTVEQFKSFSDYSKENIEAYTGFNILFWTGLRIGELLALTAKDINLEAKTISVNKNMIREKGKRVTSTTKTDESVRTIPITDQLVKIIEEYLSKIFELEKEDLIFNYDSTHYRRLLKKYATEADLEPIRVHDLRHSHASLLIHLGINPLLIAKRLGHVKVETTLNTYAHVYPDSSEKMIAILEDL